MSDRPLRVSVIVPTIGRVVGLETLLHSLANQTLAPFEVLVTDQSEGFRVQALLEEWRNRIPVRRLTSKRGASAGRNAGINALSDTDIVLFTDDDCWLEPHMLQLMASRLAGAPWDGITGRADSALGQRAEFGREQVRLDKRSVWTHAVEAAMFLPKYVLDDIGGFDESLGVGAGTRWESGEGTDLLLRGLKAGYRFAYFPDVVVHEEGAAPSARELRRKTRLYGRGTGRVYRMHYSKWDRLRVVVRPVAGAAAHLLVGHYSESRRLWQAAVGRAEGLLV